MFDFAWSEIALIGAVALIAIGPKDMPAAIRTVSGMIKKARRMAAEFQTHVDEMVRDADLGDVKKAFNDIRNLDLSSAIEKHVDPDRSIRNTFAENPLEPVYPTPSRPTQSQLDDHGELATLEAVKLEASPVDAPVDEPPAASRLVDEPQKPLAPAFIPPSMVPAPARPAAAAPPEAPAFIPPEAALQRQSKT